MQQSAIVLVGTSMVQTGSNVSAPVSWLGGQGTLVICATSFAPIVNLMLQGPNGVWIKMNTSAIQANAVLPLFLPAGSYQIHSATGSSVGIYANLCPTA